MMWEWLKENSGVISAIANALMLVVWVLYFHALLMSYRRQRKSKILINSGAGRTLRSQCIISNMSSEPIYIEAVILETTGPDDHRVHSLSDLEVAISPDYDRRSQWFQGPMEKGEYLSIGSFDALLNKASQSRNEQRRERPRHLKVTVVATYTSDSGFAAAEREYELVENGDALMMKPMDWRARQIRSRRGRGKIQRRLLRQESQ